MTMPLPREKNAATTRAGILAAAGRLFAAESYDAVGMRDVARAAGVNVALVSRYFGSKEELFRKVLLERPDSPWFGEGKSTEDLAVWLGNLAFADAEGKHQGGALEADLERLHIILRSASSPATAGMIGTAFVEDVLGPLAARLESMPGSPDAQVRAGLALIMVIGATVVNSILSVEITGEEVRAEGRRRLDAMIAEVLAPTPRP